MHWHMSALRAQVSAGDAVHHVPTAHHGVKTAELIPPTWPLKVCMHSPLWTLHSLAVPSIEAVRTVPPSFDIRIDFTALSWHANFVVSLPLRLSQSLADLSPEAVATRLSRLHKAADHTTLVWP